jgi:glucose/arabinose dehydrogenase
MIAPEPRSAGGTVRAHRLLATFAACAGSLFADPGVAEAYYTRSSYRLPADVKFEASGLATLPDGRLAVAIRKGEVWLVDNPTGDGDAVAFSRFASALTEPLGLTWHEGGLYLAQRSEVTRLEDRDADGVADVYATIANGWGISGNYHEYAYGPVFDGSGRMWITLNCTIGSKVTLAGDRQTENPWRGWAMMQEPGGRLVPAAAGLRSPFGVGVNSAGDVFATDQQGSWWGTSPLIHLQPGRFYGHAESIPDTARPGSPVKPPGELPQGLTVVEAARRIPGFALPAVWFPHVKIAQSPTGIRLDDTEGAFGPYAGQLFVGEFTLSRVNRVFLEKVNGEYQGACFPFLDGMQSAVLQMEFLQDGSMVVAQSNRGWNSLGSKSFGLERVRWTGKTPLDVLKMEAQPDGFLLTFTLPLDEGSTAKLSPGDFRMTSYTYLYQVGYGSAETDPKPVEIRRLTLSDDRRSLRIHCEPLRAGYVHELHLPALQGVTGDALWHNRAYYTLNQIPP